MSIIFNNSSFLASRIPLWSPLILESISPALAAAGRIVKERSEAASDSLRNLSLCSRISRPALAEIISNAHVVLPTSDRADLDISAVSNLHFLLDSLVDLEGFSDDSFMISSTPIRKRIRPDLFDSSEESMSFSGLLPPSKSGTPPRKPLNPTAAVFLPPPVCLPASDPPPPAEHAEVEKLSRKARKRLRAKLRRSQLPLAPPFGVQAGSTIFGPYHYYGPPGGYPQPNWAPSLPSTRPLNPRAAEFFPSSLHALAPRETRPMREEQLNVRMPEPPIELTRRVQEWLAKSHLTWELSLDPQEGYANFATHAPIIQPRFLPVEPRGYPNYSSREKTPFHTPTPAPEWPPSQLLVTAN